MAGATVPQNLRLCPREARSVQTAGAVLCLTVRVASPVTPSYPKNGGRLLNENLLVRLEA